MDIRYWPKCLCLCPLHYLPEMRKVNITLSVFVCEFIKIPPILQFSTERGQVAGCSWPGHSIGHNGSWEGGGGGGGQSHTIMLVIDMSDRAPASHTHTGQYDNSVRDQESKLCFERITGCVFCDDLAQIKDSMWCKKYIPLYGGL